MTDERAPQFFGNQMANMGKFVPFKWFNVLERENIAKGYWILLTESDEISEFSYAARYISPQERKQDWLREIEKRYKHGKG